MTNDTAIGLSAITDDYLNLIDAAAFIGIHPQSLRRLVKAGQARARLFHGAYLFERSYLHQFKAAYDPRPGRKPAMGFDGLLGGGS